MVTRASGVWVQAGRAARRTDATRPDASTPPQGRARMGGAYQPRPQVLATGAIPRPGSFSTGERCVHQGSVTYERSGAPLMAAARALFEEVREELLAARATPLSTYRLQLNRDLPFRQAAQVVPY